MDSCEASVCAQRLTFTRISLLENMWGERRTPLRPSMYRVCSPNLKLCRLRDSQTAVLETAEAFMASAAHDLLGRVLTIQDVVGGLLRLRGSDYHHPLIAMQRRQPTLNVRSLIVDNRGRNTRFRA